MDFTDTPEEAAFRAEVRAWIAANLPAIAHTLPGEDEERSYVRRALDWQREKAAAGYAGITLPRAVGGRGGTRIEDWIFEEEQRAAGAPDGPFMNVSVRMTVPGILNFGTPDQVERYALPTSRGEILWTQLFSEPGAGSDLAGVRTAAVRDGDRWIVNGQKVWSSWAHHAQRGILLARTDPDVPKHRGLSFFLLDLATPGVEIRPIRQITGQSEFNEVFLSDVVIPDSDRLGGVNEGWKVAMAILNTERMAGDEAGNSITFEDLFELVCNTRIDDRPAIENDAVQEKLARWYAQGRGLEHFRSRLITQMSKGNSPGPESALGKLVFATRLQEMSAFAMDLHAAGGTFAESRGGGLDQAFEAYMFAITMRVSGGTDEILRNQLGERVLGLPPGPRLDKDVPFKDLVG
jgi:alkylation response protein AidB-like acyl-CoA dehydrogenase